MSEEARLLLLKEKLREIRTNRIVSWIGSIPIIVFLPIVLEVLGLDYTVSLILGAFVGLIVVSILDDYYRKQKDAIMQQIEQMAFRKVG